MTTPTPTEIKQARIAAGLKLREAAELIGIGIKAWQHYESGRSIPPTRRWALFLRLTNQINKPT